MIHPIAPRHLKLSEIFFSIQGEGLRAGQPCTFVRLHGCGLRCSYCDTPYALDHRIGGEWRSFQEIKEEVRKHPTRFVEFTGGQPLEQPEVHELIRELLDEGYTVAVETGGHIDISECDPRTIRIMDLYPVDGWSARVAQRLGGPRYALSIHGVLNREYARPSPPPA